MAIVLYTFSSFIQLYNRFYFQRKFLYTSILVLLIVMVDLSMFILKIEKSYLSFSYKNKIIFKYLFE